jgi:hypothetical protein
MIVSCMNTQPDLLIQLGRNSDLAAIELRGHDSLLCFWPPTIPAAQERLYRSG